MHVIFAPRNLFIPLTMIRGAKIWTVPVSVQHTPICAKTAGLRPGTWRWAQYTTWMTARRWAQENEPVQTK